MKFVFTPLNEYEDLMVLSAPSKKHLMESITCKLILALDASPDLEQWYIGKVMISDCAVLNENFMNIDFSTLLKLDKEHVKKQIEGHAILGFGTIQPLKVWVDRN